ncbi:hypothetical protein INT47_010883 [Mucor saturninus]|uniref:Uncharacterized protein n=1 Tax=Mucor saturninus TaxID=64648 RepID=A0A8H7RAU0_9FUNG|nr:hypothetical protein INT47_010883 [Mucor saturninus]
MFFTDWQETGLYISQPCHPEKTRLYKKNSVKKPTWYGVITCHDYQTIAYILRVFQSSPGDTMTLLLGAFGRKKMDTLIILLDKRYIIRSAVVNMSWCRRMWSIASRAHMIAITGVYYSVLGGAYCSLGKSNTKYAYKAGALAIEQIKLAKRLKDPVLECKCWLYFAEDLIQLGNIQKAHKIIQRQLEFVDSIHDPALSSMLESVISKLDVAVANRGN